MRVPKMVKNGHNSVLHIFASAQEDSCSKKSRTDTKPETFLKSWKANKNHFRPISEQACALSVAYLYEAKIHSESYRLALRTATA
jgi:hypothetical protein